MLTAFIVDDEPLAREGLRLRLSAYDEIEVIAEYGDAVQAIEAINQKKPHLVFLDIEMPVLSGFDVIKQISTYTPTVIFVTAFDQYAVKAFEIHAFDYLLKPIDPLRLADVIERVSSNASSLSLNDMNKKISDLIATMAKDKPQDRFVVRSHGKIQIVEYQHIHSIEASGDYILLHTQSHSYLLRETMASAEKQLFSFGFFRVHRSHIVKLNEIKELIIDDGSDHSVILKSGVKIKLSRSYRDSLQQALGII